MQARTTRWGCLAALGALVLAALWALGGSPAATPTVSRELVERVDDQLADGWRRDSPRVDLDAAARYARGLPGIDPPADRAIRAWRHRSGAQALAVALHMPDDEGAEALFTGRATELVAAAFDLEREPLALPPFSDAVAFQAPAYRAVAARRGRTVLLVGTSLPAPASAATLLRTALQSPATP